MKQVAAVTGGSSGIGAATASKLHQAGYTVYDLSRSEKPQNGVIHIPADITDSTAVAAAFKRMEQEHGELSLLVNNAGMGISGPAECHTTAEVEKIMNVNYFGTLCCIQTALPLLRKGHNAKIINISSVAAVFPIPYQSMYSASKAAVSALTYALRNELAQQNIQVCAILPGDVRTGFTAAREKSHAWSDLYPNADSAVERMEQDEQNGMSPEKVADAVLKSAQQKHPRLFQVVGWQYKLFYLLSKCLPASVCCKLVGMLYR